MNDGNGFFKKTKFVIGAFAISFNKTNYFPLNILLANRSCGRLYDTTYNKSVPSSVLGPCIVSLITFSMSGQKNDT